METQSVYEQRRLLGQAFLCRYFLDVLFAHMIVGRSHKHRILTDPQKLKYKQVCYVYDCIVPRGQIFCIHQNLLSLFRVGNSILRN